ncbi:hypothetical protein C8J56DRAFT_891186 [Mycena floridula]|nr:hypothetical protein C8J56DRAFT_891186 [Mycena floridula]
MSYSPYTLARDGGRLIANTALVHSMAICLRVRIMSIVLIQSCARQKGAQQIPKYLTFHSKYYMESQDRWDSRSVGVAVPNAPDVLAVKPLIFFELRRINPDLQIASFTRLHCDIRLDPRLGPHVSSKPLTLGNYPGPSGS